MADTEIDISPKQDKGVLKTILKEGEGTFTVPKGCSVKVHYTGTLTDGTKFDSSRDRNEPFEFDLGKGSVIKAWDIGVATMKKGEQAILTCASEYAYGATGSPPTIPANATLKFDVEVISWKGEDLSPSKDGGIERVLLKAGEGYTTPSDESLVQVALLGKYNDNTFDERDVTFNLGEGSNFNIVDGIEEAIKKFKRGETSKLVIKPKYAFGKKGCKDFNIPADATIEYTVTLKTFEKAKDSWSMDLEEKLAQAKIFKEKGTTYFKSEKYSLAIKMYKKTLSYSEIIKDDIPTDEQKALILSANLNMALCYLKENNAFEAKTAASAVLALNPKNEKAYFRRGQAYLILKEAQLAADDFTEVLKIEPNNKAAQAQLASCNKTLKEEVQKEKKIYANMFAKFAKMDAQKEDEERAKQPDVMSVLGEWGKEDREREPTEFEKENPNILLLNGSGEFKDM